MTSSPPTTSERLVLESLSHAGFWREGEWFYPPGDKERAAVRLSVFGGQFQIWRRRNLRNPWMVIVTADVGEFDEMAFSAWRDTWPLTA